MISKSVIPTAPGNFRCFAVLCACLSCVLPTLLPAQTASFTGLQSTIAVNTPGLNNAQGIAVNGAGDVFIADYGNNQVEKIPANGGAQTTVGTGLNSPSGVAVDFEGNVYIADTGNSRLVKVPAGGGAETVVTILVGGLGLS